MRIEDHQGKMGMETEEDLAVEAASGVEDLEVEGLGGEDAGDKCPTYILFGLARRGGYPLGLRCMSRIREDTRSFTVDAFSWEK